MTNEVSPARRKREYHPKWWRAFYEAYGETLNVSESARQAGVHRDTVYKYMGRKRAAKEQVEAKNREVGYEALAQLVDRMKSGKAKDETYLKFAALVMPELGEKPNALVQLNIDGEANVDQKTLVAGVDIVKQLMGAKSDGSK